MQIVYILKRKIKKILLPCELFECVLYSSLYVCVINLMIE